MPRMLWLKAERTRELEAIVLPATADDVLLLLEFLEASVDEQTLIVRKLHTQLAQQRRLAPEARRTIPCQRPLGLMVLMPWRQAAWLERVLASPVETVQHVRERMSQWLSSSTSGATENKHGVAQPSLLG